MSWLSNFMNQQRPYKEAQKEQQKYYQEGQGYVQPYIQHGEEGYAGLSGAMNNLLNPEELYNKWASGYKESESAKMAQQMATQQGLNAASSLGLMGSSPALQAIQGGTAQIGLDERQKYLDYLMNAYMGGTGIAQGIYGTGASAAGQASQNAMGMGKDAAQLKYGEKSAQGNLFGNLLGTGAGLVGGALGNKFGNQQPQYNLYGSGGYTPGYGQPLYR